MGAEWSCLSAKAPISVMGNPAWGWSAHRPREPSAGGDGRPQKAEVPSTASVWMDSSVTLFQTLGAE